MLTVQFGSLSSTHFITCNTDYLFTVNSFCFTYCTQDIISGVVCALFFFALSVPMEFYSGEWSEINGIIEFVFEVTDNFNNIIDPTTFMMLFNLDKLIPASGAAAVRLLYY